MGSGYNESEAASNSARGKASTRTPVHFWLDVPYYEYDLECGDKTHLHTFQSRTPITEAEEHDTNAIVWCNRCQNYSMIPINAEPLNRPVSTDELVGFEQDKGILRERIAMAVQDAGFLEDDGSIMEFAIMYGVPVAEIKKINAGLRAPEGLSGEPDMCSAGLHEMTMDNISITRGRRQCKACRTIAQRNRRASKKG
jgi:hypothetical protein